MAKIGTPFQTKTAEKTMDNKHNLAQRTANENAACLRRILRKQAAFSFAVLCTSIILGSQVLSDPICCSFLTWFSHIFVRGSLCLSTVSLSRQRLDILDFTCCLLSPVLHVTLAKYWQKFRFKFHLMSSLSVFSEYMGISYPASRVPFDLSIFLGRPKRLKRKIEGDSARRVDISRPAEYFIQLATPC